MECGCSERIYMRAVYVVKAYLGSISSGVDCNIIVHIGDTAMEKGTRIYMHRDERSLHSICNW